MPLLKQWLVPGSIEFLMAGTLLASLLLLIPSPRFRRLARVLVIGLATTYLLLSLPIVADAIVAASAAGFSPVQAADAGGASVVVVLDGGGRHISIADRSTDVPDPATVLRAFEAIRVYRLLPSGAWAIVSAGGFGDASQQKREGSALRDELVRGGVPADRIVTDTTSRSTVEHTRFVRSWLNEHHVGRFVLVTSATHRETGDADLPRGRAGTDCLAAADAA